MEEFPASLVHLLSGRAGYSAATIVWYGAAAIVPVLHSLKNTKNPYFSNISTWHHTCVM